MEIDGGPGSRHGGAVTLGGMTGSQHSGRRRSWAPIAAGIAAGAGVMAVWLVGGPDERGAAPDPAATRAVPGAASGTTPRVSPAAEATPPVHGAYDTERPMKSGETVTVAFSTLPTETPAVVYLEVPAPPAGTGTLAVRVLAEGRDPIELAAPVEGDARDRVRVEIEPGWIPRGRVILEVKTLEETHLPLRRYALEVR